MPLQSTKVALGVWLFDPCDLRGQPSRKTRSGCATPTPVGASTPIADNDSGVKWMNGRSHSNGLAEHRLSVTFVELYYTARLAVSF